MKGIIGKMQALSHKAAQLKKAIDAAPGHAAQLRQTVLMTADQLRNVRDEVDLVATGLRAEGEAQISQILSELNEHTATIEEAGYEMIGIDLEVSPIQRLIVRLEQFEEVDPSRLRALIAANSSRRTIEAILAAIEKANEIAAAVDLKYLAYRELIVNLGPAPAVRLSWKVLDDEPVTPTMAASPPLAPQLAPFAQSSFFAPRAEPAVRVLTPAAVEPATAAAPSPPAPSPPAPGAPSWDRSALDRFKKMPGSSKYSR